MRRLAAFALPIAVIATLSAAAPNAASAQYDGDRYDRGFHDERRFGHDGGPRWDTARVVDVQPILAPGEPVYRRQCWQEPVRFVSRERAPRGGWGHDHRYAHDDYGYRERRGNGLGPNTNAVLGGIVGAAIGNQIGDGDGRRAATVAGALLGGAIARDASQRHRHGRDAYGYRGREVVVEREHVRYEQRCDMVPTGLSDDRVVGYRVRYDYNGFEGWTETAHHPGNTIRVRIEVTPEA